MKTDTIKHSFSGRLFKKATCIFGLCMLMLVGTTPISAQVYSTAQHHTPYDSRTGAAYGSSYGNNNNLEQPAYNSYQSTVYQPFASSPSIISGRRNSNGAPSTGGSDPTNPNIPNPNNPGGGSDYEGNGFLTPDDPGHQSNQSPVGEAWVMLLFAAVAAAVVFVRQRKAAVKG